jgi:hypothetical protein
VALHPDVDPTTVARSLAGAGAAFVRARVLAADRLVVAGVAADGHASRATDPAVAHLVDQPAEAT